MRGEVASVMGVGGPRATRRVGVNEAEMGLNGGWGNTKDEQTAHALGASSLPLPRSIESRCYR